MQRWLAMAAVACLAAGAAPADDAGQWPVGDAVSMWDEPYMVGSYRHWADIYPVHGIAAGETAVPLPYGAPIGPVEFWGNGEKFTLESYIDHARVTGLLVIRDGEIRLEAYGNGADETSQMTSQSVAKRSS